MKPPRLNEYIKIFLLALVYFIVGLCVGNYLNNDSKNTYNNYRQVIPINNKHLLVNSDLEYPLIVDRTDNVVGASILHSGMWEPHVSNVLKKLVKKGDIVVEVGANYGYHTILLGKLIGNKGHIYTYEANKDLCNQVLYKNIVLNDLINNVHINCIAVSDQEQKAMFLIGYPNLGGSFVVGKNTNIKTLIADGLDYPNYTVKTVDTVYLDKDLNNLKNIDILRMDAEGAELAIINGAKNLIESSKHIKIIMEWSTIMLARFGDIQELLDKLEALSFKFYQISYDANLIKISKEDMMKIPFCEVVITRDNL